MPNKIYKQFRSIFMNFSYNLSYQIFSLILPIISVPYITRIFSQKIVGMNSVMQANCTYFVLFGMLGIGLLGPREIAKCQGNKQQVSDIFCQIYHIQFFAHIIAMVLYGIYCFFCEDKLMAGLYILYLISSLTDISWLYMGLEDFKSIAIRNIFVKLVAFFLLFLLVKSGEDRYNYICTLYLPQISINIYMWVKAVKSHLTFTNQRLIQKKSPFFKDALSLFFPQIASGIYTILDKTILGLFSSYNNVAIYEQGQILLRLFLAIVPSFSKVMMPRISNSLQNKSQSETMKYMKMSAEFVCGISFLMFFGVLACAQIFVDWYLTQEYSYAGVVIQMCSPIILAVSGSNLIAIQYMIPLGIQKKYTTSIFIASGINVIFNLLLTPFIGIYGVCMGSIVAEISGFALQLFFVKKFLNLKMLFSNIYVYFLSGIVMFIVLYFFASRMRSNFLNLIILVFLGSFIYFLGLFVMFKFIKKKK